MAVFKLVIVGAEEVGKTALAFRLRDDRFVAEREPVFEDSFRKYSTVDDKSCLLEVFDTPGREEHCLVRDAFARSAQGFLLVYSITSRSSFDKISTLRDQILHVKDVDRFPFILVGNKCDLNEERQVTTEEGQNLAQSFGCPFLETSAKTPINVDLVFDDLIREVRKEAQKSAIEAEASKKKEKDCLIM